MIPAPRPWTFDYRPSLLLCYTLVFWNATCLLCEISTLTYLPLIYTFTTYLPTIYFSLHSIRAHAQSRYADVAYFKSSLRWAVGLACMWCATLGTHAYILWTATMWKDVVSLPLFSAFMPTFIMVYIACRYVIHQRLDEPGISLGSDEEETVSSAGFHADSTALQDDSTNNSTVARDSSTLDHRQAVSNAMTGPRISLFEPYTPSVFLLLISTALIISATVADFKFIINNAAYANLVLPVSLLQVCISVSFLQLYIIFQTVRKAPLAKDTSTIPNLTLEFSILWLSTRFMVISFYIQSGKYDWWSGLGAAEAFLLLYHSARYALEISKAKKHKTTVEGGSILANAASNPSNDLTDVYQPSAFLLAGCIVLSVLSIVHWARHGFFVLNVLVFAHVPTIIVYSYSILQIIWLTLRPSHTDNQRTRYVKAAEWSVGISVLWTSAYAPNIFVWSYIDRLQDWRWLPYFAVMYIALRYIRDADVRENQGMGISLPPDDADLESDQAPS